MWELLALAAILFVGWYIPRCMDSSATQQAEAERQRADCIRRARERAEARSYARIEAPVDWDCNDQ